MNMLKIFVGLLGAMMIQSPEFAVASGKPVTVLDLQGHRGARGVMPENTLPAFAYALTLATPVEP